MHLMAVALGHMILDSASQAPAYAVPPAAGIGLFFATRFGYRRAKETGRNRWLWATLCLITGAVGAAFLWLWTHDEVKSSKQAEGDRDEVRPSKEAEDDILGKVSVWSDTGVSPRLLKKVKRDVRLPVLGEVNGYYEVELPDGTIGYAWADDVPDDWSQE